MLLIKLTMENMRRYAIMLSVLERWKQRALKATWGMPEYMAFCKESDQFMEEIRIRKIPLNKISLMLNSLFLYHLKPCARTKKDFMQEYSLTLAWMVQNGYN